MTEEHTDTDLGQSHMSNEHHFGITRRIEIDAAHRVPDHKSKCFNIHGHRYVIEAQLQGPTLSGAQTGMVMDFAFLKQCMMETIHNPCDHATIMSLHDPMLGVILGGKYTRQLKMYEAHLFNDLPGWKLFLIPEAPTAENLAMIWHGMLEDRISVYFSQNNLGSPPPKLTAVDVWETPNCVARYPFGRAK